MPEDRWGTPAIAYPLGRFERVDDGAVPERFQATFQSEDIQLQLFIRVEGGRPLLTSLSVAAIEPREELSRLESLPLRRLVDRAVAAAFLVNEEPGVLRPRTRDIPERKAMTPKFKQRVAETYMEAERSGVNGVDAVRKLLGANSYRTAARWVAQAREANLIAKGKGKR